MAIEITGWERGLARAGPFECGAPQLDRWWREQAGQAERRHRARVRVAVEDGVVVGFCAVSVAAIAATDIGERRRGPVGVAVIARLAVARSHQGRGLGTRLVVDALERIARASTLLGFELVLVEAKDIAVADFYRGLGFASATSRPTVLYRRVRDLRNQ